VAALLELGGHVFATGRSRYLDSDRRKEATPKIFVKILPGELPFPLLARIDTGAAWSVLDAEIAEALSLFERPGPAVGISTRSGVFRGKLIRTPLTLLADEGESFELDTTLFASHEWSLGNFIGYAGFLERIRFAVDPSTNDFYFGGLSEIHKE
jgi:hypothetical protein